VLWVIVFLATVVLNEFYRLLMRCVIALLIFAAVGIGITGMVIKGYRRLRRG
jgi:hypothetical protein